MSLKLSTSLFDTVPSEQNEGETFDLVSECQQRLDGVKDIVLIAGKMMTARSLRKLLKRTLDKGVAGILVADGVEEETELFDNGDLLVVIEYGR